MSEGGQKDQQSQKESESIRDPKDISSTTTSADKEGGDWTGNQPRRARTAVPLLVDVYGSVVQRNTAFNANKTFQAFIRNLANNAQSNSSSSSSSSERSAVALLKTLDTAFSNSSENFLTSSIPANLLNSIVPILEGEESLTQRKHKKQSDNLCRKIKKKLAKSSQKMDPGFPADLGNGPAHIASALADRISPTSGADPSAGVTNILSDLGPACTRSESTFRETLAEIMRSSSTKMDEAVMARIIYFFSTKGATNKRDGESGGLSSSLLGSLLAGRDSDGMDGNRWNLDVVMMVIAVDYRAFDWVGVALKWDFYDFVIRGTMQFQTLLELYRAGAQRNPPVAALTAQWRHPAAQCSMMEAMLSVTPNVFMCELNELELADASTAAPEGQISSAPNPRCWASSAVLQRLLYLSDIPALARRIRDLFVKGLLGCPEVLLCALVRLQLTQGSDISANTGKQMKNELMRELIPLFFKPNAGHRVQNGPAACRRLWAISPNTVTAACIEAWRSTATEAPQIRLASIVHIISIVGLLPSPEAAMGALLSGNKDTEFSVAIAFVMADKANFQLKQWLLERIPSGGPLFCTAVITYLAKLYQTAAPRAGEAATLVSLENMLISLQVLHSLDSKFLAQKMVTSGDQTSALTIGESVKSLTDACVAVHPTLRGGLSQALPSETPSASAGGASDDDDIDEMANSYFQKIYTSEQSIGEVVEMLKRFKTSGDTRENEIFACMIRNLFDEYRFFSKYPEKELRITGILFGTLIKEQLVSSITLGIALRYVLEALRRPPSPQGSTTSSSGKMFRFGMFALEQFKERLHEWPQYCSHIVQIPHLKEGYAALVGEIEVAMAESQNRGANAVATAKANAMSASAVSNGDNTRNTGGGGDETGSTRSAASTQASEPAPSRASAEHGRETEKRVAQFGPNLGRAVNSNVDTDIHHEAPPDSVLDRVQFLINNVSPSNVEQKSMELRDMLEPRFFDWLGHYLVVKRISAQPNFHALYLAFLDHLGEYGRGLIEAILGSVYLNIGKLLRSPKITTSTSERSLLKNLGSWLGQITIARNRPILQIMLDCKELLFQGYENGRLIAVTPFVAKILEGAKSSVVFRPPNPWVMGLLGVFRALYGVEDLKMNIKFEVEVLCKNLGLKLDDIPPRTEALKQRVPPVKERNPDFNMKSSMAAAAAAAGNTTGKSVAAAMAGAPPVPSPDPKNAVTATSFPNTTAEAVRNQGGGSAANQKKSVGSAQDQQTVIPNLAAYVTINQSLSQLLQQTQGNTLATSLNAAVLKRSVPIAVDRAIREIIQPVVERSVSIACITSKEIVTKDFATEGDENKMHKAAQLMVVNLAGSLALVTCRDPLRSSVSTHLRQLLTNSIGGNDKLTEQEQETIESIVAICATDNLELGCKLIEKAATEKAVRDIDEALSSALTSRRKHREQTGGQPYYDLAVLGNGNQRYPGALPEPLRPQRGGLRSEQLRVYEAFQRMPRQHAAAAMGAQNGVGVTSTRTGGADSEPATKLLPPQQLNLEALTSIATKLDSSISTLLTAAGSRAPEITLSMLPADHEIGQLLSAVSQIMPRALSPSEKKAVLGFAQSIFRRLYELKLSEPLRLEALVVLLEKINESCPQLGQDLGTWTTYAPTETEVQRKLHRTVLLLLVRSNLVSAQELDGFLSVSADNGRNPVWVEFSLLFVRTAFLERIASPSHFPKLMDLMTKVAEGRSQASAQVTQTLHKPILRMLEEIRGISVAAAAAEPQTRAPTTPAVTVAKAPSADQTSMLSPASLMKLNSGARKAAEALEGFARNDHHNANQQVTSMLDSWIRIHNEAVANENTLAQYLQLLQQFGVGKTEEQTERFFRLATQIAVEAVRKSSGSGGDQKSLNYAVIDIYSMLLPLIVRYMGGGSSSEQVAAQRVAVLNKLLAVIVRCLMWDYEKKKSNGMHWDQRPWFRLLLNLLADMNSPSPLLDPLKAGILGVFGSTFHILQPLVIPGFSFAWLELVSHRSFFPSLLLLDGQKGWSVAHQLVVDLLLFLEPHLRKIDLSPAIKKLYEGTMRVLLVLLHDFPSFLASYHLSLCNVIPENCVQLRNVILSAVPRGLTLPDPFTPNLKIDSLPEISQNPLILSNVLGPLESLRSDLDGFLKDRQRSDFVAGLLPRLLKPASSDVDTPRVNSLVLYVGMHGINRLQTSQTHQTLAHTPELEILQKLMELNDHGRYITLNAVANQLRYPSSHTHYFSCVMLYLFSEAKNSAIKEQITRVLLERLILHRPHPWGLLITFIELIKNQRYQFWSHPFTRCATEIEKLFESVARSCMAPGSQRATLVGENGQ